MHSALALSTWHTTWYAVMASNNKKTIDFRFLLFDLVNWWLLAKNIFIISGCVEPRRSSPPTPVIVMENNIQFYQRETSHRPWPGLVWWWLGWRQGLIISKPLIFVQENVNYNYNDDMSVCYDILLILWCDGKIKHSSVLFVHLFASIQI